MILPSGHSTYDYSVSPEAKGWGKGWPNCENRATRTVVAHRSGTRWAQVDVRVADLVELLLNEVERRGYLFTPGWNWGGSCRAIAGTNRPSNHSWGIAIDMDAPINTYNSTGQHSLPSYVFALFRAYGFGVGADYKGARKDWMHAEFMGRPDDAATMAKLVRRALGVAQEQPSTPTVGNVTAPPVAPTVTTGGLLRSGSKGPEVRAMQDRLIAHRFLPAGQADGDFGPRTEAAVKAFQNARGLHGDGVVGPQTWAKLNEVPSAEFAATVQQGSTGDVVKDVQDRLVERGFLTAEKRATGYGTFGPATDAGVRAFQRSKGLTADGIVGPATWAALHS